MNDELCRMLGRPREQMLAARHRDVCHPDDYPRVTAAVEHLVGTGEPVSIDARYLRADGDILFANSALSRVEGPDGRPESLLAVTVDLTERKRHEDELLYRVRQFEALINQAPIGVYLIDADFRIAQINPIALPVFANVPDAIGRDFDEVIHIIREREFADEVVRIFRNTLETGESYQAPEVAQLRADRGELKYYEWRVDRITLSDGRHGAVCYFRDISGPVTARQAALAEVTERSERQSRLYDTIMSSTPDLVYVFGLDYRFSFANRALLDMWGRTHEESIGKSLLEVGYEPWHAEMHEREIDQVIATKRPVRGEVAFPHAALGRRVYDYIFVPVLNEAGEVESIAGTTRDVTERKAQEAALRDSEERLLIATSAAQLGLHDYDVTTGRISWDHRTRGLWGVEPDEPITYELWRDSLHPADREQAEAAVLRSMDATGSGRYFSQYRVKDRRDGTTRWIEATGVTTFSDGKAVRLVGTAQDITGRKQTEEALVEADRRKDEFLATLAHELRNPLAAIRMATSVLDQTRDDPARLAVMTSIVERQSSQLVRLIDDLLDVSRITRGMIELRRRPVDLSLVVEHAVDGMRQVCEERGVRLSVTPAPDRIVIDADPFRFSQVISNLVNNAVKFSDPGGEVRVGTERTEDQAIVYVRDTGVGIAPDDLPRIFGMFAQAGVARSRAAGGLGIGLALAKSIVEMHDGTIEAKSDGAGTGAEFIVRVPAIDAEADTFEADNDAGPGEPPRAVRSARILAVDDNRDALDTVAAALRIRGHDVDTADNGVEALSRAQATRPEVILLDIGMPELDGYEVARRLRSEPWGKDIYIVAVTGWGQEKDRRDALEAGFDAHLTKPADPDALEEMLWRRQTASPPPGQS